MNGGFFPNCGDLPIAMNLFVTSNFTALDHRSIFSRDKVISPNSFSKLPIPQFSDFFKSPGYPNVITVFGGEHWAITSW